MKIKGIYVAIIEVVLYFIITTLLRYILELNDLNIITYYWLAFTVLTGIWENSYVNNKKQVSEYASYLIHTDTHVWENYYPISTILPHKLAIIFYAEYAAFADRDYKNMRSKWSIYIEGSHMTYCAYFSLLSLVLYVFNIYENYLIAMSVAMGTQFMNSYLYLRQYRIQIRDKDSSNYWQTPDFPCGIFMKDRPFMWINLFWSLMPSLVILMTFVENILTDDVDY